MAYGSYAPAYIEPMRVFDNDQMGFRLMWELIAHADPLGMSYPGHSRLAGLIHRAPQSVHAKLIELSEMDYIRCHIEQSEYSKKAILWYQVSPLVMFIRDEILEEATQKWEQGRRYEIVYDWYCEINSVSNVKQPDRNREKPVAKPTINQIPNQTIPQNGKSQKPKTRSAKPSSRDTKQHGKADTQTASSPNSTPANGGIHPVGATVELNPPRSAAPPPFDVPLVNAYDEMAAYKLSIFGGGTRIEQAREAVWRYGEDGVQKAKELAARKAQLNPIGYVFEALKKGYIKGVIPRQGGSDERE